MSTCSKLDIIPITVLFCGGTRCHTNRLVPLALPVSNHHPGATPSPLGSTIDRKFLNVHKFFNPNLVVIPDVRLVRTLSIRYDP